MQLLNRYMTGDLAVQITKAIPVVVSTVQPDCKSSAWLQVLGKLPEGGFAVGRVMKHADAVNAVETSWDKRKIENIGLECHEVPICEIRGGHFRGGTEIDSDHCGAPPSSDIREPAHAASDIQDDLPT